MAQYRNNLPQLSERLFLTDGGLETTLIYHDGLDLPEFAAFALLKDASGYQTLWNYYETYIELALSHHVGFILESPTWRANPDWAEKLGYSPEAMMALNQKAIALLIDLRHEYETPHSPMVISGCIGPRGDGYRSEHMMTASEARAYHSTQISIFAESAVDMVSAMTLNYCEEAVGITQAAHAHDLPVVISFTVETDGRLPSGQTLADAIVQVDQQTQHGPAYYMINCAHPSHLEGALTTTASWRDRIRGVRANASTKSHAELDQATVLDEGNPAELGRQHLLLKRQLPTLSILGGCCGTDHRHVRAICEACLPVDGAH